MMERVVLIDLGSNAVRFALASVVAGRSFRMLDEARVQTRLAAGRHFGPSFVRGRRFIFLGR